MIIIDTGCISDYVRGVKEVRVKVKRIGFDNCYITPIIYIECRRWLSHYKGFTDAERREYMKILNSMPIIHLDKATGIEAIKISNKNINAKVPDTLIAATCILKKMPLYTINTKDFVNVKGVKLL